MTARTAFRTCPLCEATCGLEIEIENEKVKRIRGDRADPFSKGFICPKGSTLKQLHEDPDRLQTPMVRRGGEWLAVSWHEAYVEIERRLLPIIDEHGPDAVAIYIGNPVAHNFHASLVARTLVKALRTKNIFSASTVDQMPKQVACAHMFGGGLIVPVPDLDRTDYLLMLGANPYESNGSLATAPDWPGRLEAIRARGGQVVVVDPRRSKTAEHADRWVPIRPGTDAALLLGMIHVLFERDLVRPGLLEGHLNGIDEVRRAVAPFTPAAVEAFTGVPASTIEQLTADLATAPTAAVYGRIGTHTVSFGTLAAWGVDVLNALTGNLDRPGGAMFPMATSMGRGKKARQFVSGRWRSRVRDLPEFFGELPVATLVDEIETPGQGQVRALVTIAGNPVLTIPDSERVDTALGTLEFMVAIDPYLNETTRHAHVVLPPPSLLEKSHFDIYFQAYSLRNFAKYSPAAFETDHPTEFEILGRLAALISRLGVDVDPDVLTDMAVATLVQAAVSDPLSPIHGRDAGDVIAALAGLRGPEKILDLLIRNGSRGDAFGAVPDGLTLARLAAEPHGIDFGPLVPRIPEVLATPSGKVELAPGPIIADLSRLEAAMHVRANGELLLVGRRQLRSNNSWLHNVEVMMKGKDRCTLHIHADDARRLGLTDGGMAAVTSRVGKVEATVELTDSIMRGVVSLPYGWGHDRAGARLSVASRYPGVNTNILTDSEPLDPLSGNAVLNGIPVTVAPA